MASTMLRKIFGSRNERLIKKMGKYVAKINALEPAMQALSDDKLKAKTQEFRDRLKNGEALKDLLPEAFAVVRETSVRTLGMRHFDVQLIGGIVLHSAKIAEMRTGEGKTLVSTLPAYLNALTGRGVHIITVNDYLAKRDAEWMKPIYDFLDLTIGVNLPNMLPEEKGAVYSADITYGTNNEFGFDYLRDNMAFSLEDKVQRELHYAIIDEVDSILIDESRTPLIISGPAEDSSELYTKIDRLVPKLKKQEEEDGPGDFSVDEKTKQAFLTEEGHATVENLMLQEGLLKEGESLYDSKNIALMHHLNAAMRAHAMYHIDVDYIVKDNQIIIVDEHTGRLMEGRRWSEGLHQAVEAKEGVRIKEENQTLASITFQNFFRLYEKLSGMTGTADTEAYEFQQIYGLEVVVVPTNKPIIRDDRPDLVYLNQHGKFNAIVNDIKARSEKGQPILLGTASIDASEYLSSLLKKQGIKHQVLNAKQHEREAKIIAEAGQPGTVTIATNMAGRGTDIVLGGNVNVEVAELDSPSEEQVKQLRADWQKRHDQVLTAGGLHVMGSERHESRRIDNQLRGRCGRQGDPGSSQFYLSLEDNLMRIFASERVANLMRRLGMTEDEAIEHKMVTRAIENAQRKVEGHNFDIRKQLLEFDDVANDQRKVVYQQRAALLRAEDVSSSIATLREEVIEDLVNQYIPPQSFSEQWDVSSLEKRLENDFALKLPVSEWLEKDDQINEEIIRQKTLDAVTKVYNEKVQLIGPESAHQLEKSIMLQILDTSWKEHLAAMDYLRQGIHLRGYAQKNPVQEFKRESFEMFTDMLKSVKYDVIAALTAVQIKSEEEMDVEQPQPNFDDMQFLHADSGALPEEANAQAAVATPETFVRNQPKVGRNEPCPCGSGNKYKQCHGKIA